MKPTPQQILSALNEIIQESKKTELKAEKVELALIDDIEKLLDKGLAEKRKSEKIIRKAADELREGSQ